MPELPEVHALAAFLDERLAGRAFTAVALNSFAALKTFDPPLDELVGATIASVRRHGKFVDIDAGVHLVFHLARAGWVRWYEDVPRTPLKPGRSPVALRARVDDDSGFDLTEAGTQKSLAIYAVHDPTDVEAIARLGPDPLDDGFTPAVLATIVGGRRTQIKGVLRDQSIVAGIGNAYSDEILHAARLSPFALASTLDAEQVDRLYTAIRSTLGEAIDIARGRPPAALKDSKRLQMRAHGRAGKACPACGDTVRSVFFADRSLEYCPTCQTDGKTLADRRLSRLLK